MDPAIPIEKKLRSCENQQRELRDIAEEAYKELASLEGMGGFFARMMGSAEGQRQDLEKTIATANERAEALQPQIEDLRAELASLRRSAAAARPPETTRPVQHQPPPAPSPFPSSTSPSTAHPSSGGVQASASVNRPSDPAALMQAKQAAQRLRAAIGVAVDENQSEAVRRARRGRQPLFGESMSLVEMASDQLGVLKEVRAFSRRGADSEVASALQDLRVALGRAGVSGWESEDTPGLTGPFHMLNEALILTGASYDRSKFHVAESVEKLHELSGQVAMLEMHLDERLAQAQAGR